MKVIKEIGPREIILLTCTIIVSGSVLAVAVMQFVFGCR